MADAPDSSPLSESTDAPVGPPTTNPTAGNSTACAPRRVRPPISFLPLVLSTIIIVADQATKRLVQTKIAMNSEIPVIPGFFDLVYVKNTGAAFGTLSNYTWLLTLISIVMLGVIILFRRAFLDDTLLHRIILGLLVGGIIGNLIDRIKDQFVTDFLHFYIGEYSWPSFNIADAAICIAVGLYILFSLRGQPPSTHPLQEKV